MPTDCKAESWRLRDGNFRCATLEEEFPPKKVAKNMFSLVTGNGGGWAQGTKGEQLDNSVTKS